MTALLPIVGLIGKKRVGKDTFAAVLVEEFGFARVAFADPLKEMALTIDPVIGWYAASGTAVHMRLDTAVALRGWEEVKDVYPEARRFLQRLGDGVRQFDPDFWVRAGMREVARLREWKTPGGWDKWAPQPVVITDVRYPNEADAIREAGGVLVRIVRPGVDDGDTHASETALDGYRATHTIYNEFDIEALRFNARELAGILGE